MRNRLLPLAGLVLVGAGLSFAACQPGPPPMPPTASGTTTATPTKTAAAAATVAGKTYTQPDQVVEAGKQYTATIVTDKGNIVIELYADKAPRTVNSFVFLAQQGFFNGIKFHRVEPGFVVQGGDPLGNGNGGPGYSFEEDQNDLLNTQGTLSMAKSPGSTKAGSQFFINLVDNPSLDQSTTNQKRFYPFGKVIAGMDVVTQLVRNDVMKSVTITAK